MDVPPSSKPEPAKPERSPLVSAAIPRDLPSSKEYLKVFGKRMHRHSLSISLGAVLLSALWVSSKLSSYEQRRDLQESIDTQSQDMAIMAAAHRARQRRGAARPASPKPVTAPPSANTPEGPNDDASAGLDGYPPPINAAPIVRIPAVPSKETDPIGVFATPRDDQSGKSND